jgi:uncharacterized protein
MSCAAPHAFHLMAKPAGAVCNLDCKYCFYLSKQELYPNSTQRMSDEVLVAYFRQLIEAHDSPELEVNVSWQGGEPTLIGLPFFERSVELVERFKRPQQRVQYTIQTNGTLLDEAWCAFFKRHSFLVGLSIDGPREMHDAYRVHHGGKGSSDQVMRGWEVLAKHGVDVNILCTLHAANADHPLEVYRFFRDDLGAQFLQFIPIVERCTPATLPLANAGWSKRVGHERPLYTQSGNLVTERSIRAEQYGTFLVSVFDEWVRRDVGRVFVQIFDVTLGAHLGQYSLCIFAPRCGNALALEHNGDLYSCDHYVEPNYFLGNIRDRNLVELLSSPQQRAFGQHKEDSLPLYCRECDVRFACNGGCPRDRFIQTPDGHDGLNYLCAGYKQFFQHVNQPMRKMAELLQQRRPPAEIMQWYASEIELKERANEDVVQQPV